jgi:hypothetical protein
MVTVPVSLPHKSYYTTHPAVPKSPESGKNKVTFIMLQETFSIRNSFKK